MRWAWRYVKNQPVHSRGNHRFRCLKKFKRQNLWMKALILKHKKKTLTNTFDNALVITISLFNMSQPFCCQTGLPHSEYCWLLKICPHCKVNIPDMSNKNDSYHNVPKQHHSSTTAPIIDLEQDPPALLTALPRFLTFHPYAIKVESHRQTAIRKVPRTNKQSPHHAGSKPLSIQIEASKMMPIQENVTITIIKGLAASPRSFMVLGKHEFLLTILF